MSTHVVTFDQFKRKYHDEASCLPILISAKWPNGYRCPRCACVEAHIITTRRLPLYECRNCKYQASLLVGTIMQGSRTLLHKWFQALFLIANPSSSINAVELASVIQVTYKTAWLILHKLRHAIQQGDAQQLLTGLVEVISAEYNPCNFHIKGFKTIRNEQPFVGGASLNFYGEVSYVKLKHVFMPKHHPNKELSYWDYSNFIETHVSSSVRVPFIHYGSKKYNACDTINIICDSVPVRINERYYGVSDKHLQSYLDEVSYRINYSLKPNRAVSKLFRLFIDTPAVTYKQLISRKPMCLHVQVA
ncbi:transposase [Paenibacillus swuensis]|uniref:transposase n=1 Tax=Paenibacillus swuensis TaxID=1178515 RepID=UPI000A85033D|nr:transposase [Paenibacillus swuensis]